MLTYMLNKSGVPLINLVSIYTIMLPYTLNIAAVSIQCHGAIHIKKKEGVHFQSRVAIYSKQN